MKDRLSKRFKAVGMVLYWDDKTWLVCVGEEVVRSYESAKELMAYLRGAEDALRHQKKRNGF